MSLIFVRKSEIFLHLIFYAYVLLLLAKKTYDFQDGYLDIVILGIVTIALLIRPGELYVAVMRLFRESFFKYALLLLAYYIALSNVSYNSVENIAIEFLSVFKWLIYFISGYLFSSVYDTREGEFPPKRSFVLFAWFVLWYSVLTYNWSGVGGGSLFGFYTNSYESLFSLRSVFALFAFVVFAYGLKTCKEDMLIGVGLLVSSFLFLFMSGNRKMIIAVMLIVALYNFGRRSKSVTDLFKYVTIVITIIMLSMTSLFESSIEEYTNVEQPRISSYIVSYKIAIDNFPIGSGPATFGSKGSFVNYSPIYGKYGLDNKWGFREGDNVHFYNDTYWAQVIGQYGFMGVILVFIVIMKVFKFTRMQQHGAHNKVILYAVLFLSVVTPALQRIEIALFIFFALGLDAQRSRRMVNAIRSC